MTTLNAQITPDLTATDIANEAAPDETDRASDEAARYSTHSRVRRPAGRVRNRGRGNDCSCDESKSTKRSH